MILSRKILAGQPMDIYDEAGKDSEKLCTPGYVRHGVHPLAERDKMQSIFIERLQQSEDRGHGELYKDRGKVFPGLPCTGIPDFSEADFYRELCPCRRDEHNTDRIEPSGTAEPCRPRHIQQAWACDIYCTEASADQRERLHRKQCFEAAGFAFNQIPVRTAVFRDDCT